ncbi:MAG: Ribosomal RNA large subunit methyltransferase E [Candidatus Heimdallarchaeota archaeon LC_3]|nr:MAG: Ribosomal RNA large subunit methyltransferase E [Candidatus Heimdallarchaeota archaeon LC_3]
MDKKFRLLKKQELVIDLCGAPGGWSQYLAKKLPKSSHIILADLAKVNLPDIFNLDCLQCDITTNEAIQQIKSIMNSFSPPKEKVDLVVSDCSPKMGGNYATDHARQIYLVMHAFRIAVTLKADVLVAKVFDGKDFPDLKELLKEGYENFKIYKPPASRSESSELYIITRGIIKDYVPPEDF